MKAHFHFLTLFPQTIETWLTTSILGRAHEEGIFRFSLYNPRDFTHDKHRSVDDFAYGGGGGMVLKVEPLVEAVETIKREHGPLAQVIYFTPTGQRLDQSILEKLEEQHLNTLLAPHFILVCGHYEGVDQRFIDHWVDWEISLGDFVLTGGELPALAFADALIRRLEGTLLKENAKRNESFSIRDSAGERLLEYPHYTRPADFRGHKVPSILLSGNHEQISRWRLNRARERTDKRSN